MKSLACVSSAIECDASIGWNSIHIYYYEQDKTALILDAVRPLLDRLGEAVHAAYLVRHWRQGPHLRVHIRTDPHTWVTQVRPTADEIIGDYLRVHPSTAQLDQRGELAIHLLLAEHEQERGPLTPWLPDNSVHYLPYDPRLHVLGNPQTVALFTDYAAACTRIFFDMLDQLRSGAGTEEMLGLDVLVATSQAIAPPIDRAFVSYRAHAETFIYRSPNPAVTRASFDRYYANRRDALVDRVRQVVDVVDDPTRNTQLPHVRDWVTTARAYADRAKQLIEAGLLFPKTQPPETPHSPRAPLAKLMFGSEEFQKIVFDTLEFRIYRFMLNFTYLHLTRLGFTPYRRLRLCHAVANAVEDLYSVSADALVRAFLEKHSNEPAR